MTQPAPGAPPSPAERLRAAGVSIEAADKAIELMKVWVEKARRPEMIGGLGGFAGLFDASVLKRYDRPLLATSTDGVGTKVAIAQAMDVHDTIGFDLVGMVVDDLVVCGAEPLFMTDYIATGRVVPGADRGDRQGHRGGLRAGRLRAGRRRDRRAPGPARARRVRRGRRDHRRGRGRPAARPGPGAARRRRDRDGGQRPALQRLLAGAPRPARRAASRAAPAGRSTAHVPELGRTLGEELLEPTRIYAKACLELADRTRTHAMSHVTGGGLAANLERVMPVELTRHHPARHLDAAADLRRGPAGGRRAAGRPGGHAQLRCRAWSR